LKLNITIIRSTFIVAEKDIKIYYKKPPVLIFGLLFPIFMFISFYLGRNLDLHEFFGGFLAMSIFFTSSSVGPMITPWEKTQGTYEKLLSYPITVGGIIFADVIAGMIFGIIINIFVAVVGIILLGYSVNIIIFILAFIISPFCFSSLGVFLASPSRGTTPSNVMMLSSLVRFPLLFISGIFVPLNKLPLIGKILSFFSPITYLVDLLNYSFRATHILPIYLDFILLIIFCFLFIFLSNIFLKRNLRKGF
jgi:ABC-2 type transport system permease protein